MAAAKPRTQEQVRRDIEAEREQLAGAVEHLRGELGQAANLRGKLASKLPIVAGTAASAGFVFAGGIGATMRYFARRGREGHEKARVGRWSLRDRD
jgi:hypothetical protein